MILSEIIVLDLVMLVVLIGVEIFLLLVGLINIEEEIK